MTAGQIKRGSIVSPSLGEGDYNKKFNAKKLQDMSKFVAVRPRKGESGSRNQIYSKEEKGGERNSLCSDATTQTELGKKKSGCEVM